MKEFSAKFPALPDPATTPATKIPVAQFLTAIVAGIVVLSESKVDLSEVATPWLPGNEGDSVTLRLRYEDASGLSSPVKEQVFLIPAAPDVIPPDAPGDFGEVTIRDVVAPPVDPAVDPAPAPTV